jgi:ATP-dependent Lhr-like helicase
VALQRVGRAGHHHGGTSRGLFFCLTRDDLVECTALLRAIRAGELDILRMPEAPLDILAQQVVAACACEEQDEAGLFEQVRQAWPYRALTREAFDKVLTLLSEGVAASRGRARVHLHRDRVNGKLRARPGARLTALMNGGAIPDTFTYPVIAEPEGKQVGALDEDFAIDSSAGDIFVLGSTSWRILRVEAGTVRVEDAHGAPPNVPFWRGEAPGRTDELSDAVGRLREEVLARPDAAAWLQAEVGLPADAAELLVRYLQVSASALGAIPSRHTVVAERFFDEAGGMQLVLHAPFGSRINRAWGLALRKRFCRSFDFELQAAATDDGVLLSLSEQHSFPLLDIFDFVTPEACEEVLVQAVLQTPLFGTRFRWNASRALALERMRNGQRVPPQIQRSRSEDLLGAVFPAQLGCQDNHGGADVELPDHPLVTDTMHDCLHEALDVQGLQRLIADIRDKRVRVLAVDTPEPSPLSHQLLNSAPYTFLDEAPLEERRARAVAVRRSLPAADQAAFGALDEAAIRQVVEEAQPPLRTPDELHDALLQLGVMPLGQVPSACLDALVRDRRAAAWEVPAHAGAGDVSLPLAAEPAPGFEVKADVSRAAWGTPVNGGGRRWEWLCLPAESLPGWGRLPSSPSAGGAAARSLPAAGARDAGPAGPSLRAEAGRVPVGGDMPGGRFAVAAERLPHVHALWPRGTLTPPLALLPGDGVLAREVAAAHVVRGWMEQAGPCTAAELALKLQLPEPLVDEALHALENEGSVLRGTFRPGRPPGEVEWCDRRLLQRIHRLTVGRLRREIEPLSAQDAMRFLFRWHHLEPGDGLKGPGGMLKALALLEGFEAPASTWEGALLPSRVQPYAPEVLEQLSWRGEVAWGRLAVSDRPAPGPRRGAEAKPPDLPPVDAPARRATLGRSAPLTFCRRESLDWMLAAARPGAVLSDGGMRWPEGLSGEAREVAEWLERRGASFFRDLQAQLRRSPEGLEDALRELLSRGVVTADAVENLRVLLSPAKRRAQRGGGGTGRWSLLAPTVPVTEPEQREALARLLLRRYGILFRDVALREPLVRSWRELSFVLRRMEARGEVRGGRFVAGVAGEQFALPEAVDLARAVRRAPKTGLRVRLSTCDPLNLTGVLTPGPRVAAVPGRFVTWVDGIQERQEQGPDGEDAEAGVDGEETEVDDGGDIPAAPGRG